MEGHKAISVYASALLSPQRFLLLCFQILYSNLSSILAQQPFHPAHPTPNSVPKVNSSHVHSYSSLDDHIEASSTTELSKANEVCFLQVKHPLLLPPPTTPKCLQFLPTCGLAPTLPPASGHDPINQLPFLSLASSIHPSPPPQPYN